MSTTHNIDKKFLAKLGQEIAANRKLRGLTQNDLAEATNVEPETISRFERGMTAPSLQRLIEIANVLGVGLHNLLTSASPLKQDGLIALETQMSKLSTRDQAFVIETATRLTEHLKPSK